MANENFPMPMMSRDWKVHPAMVNGWLAKDIVANLEQRAVMGFPWVSHRSRLSSLGPGTTS
jgi:hypothetical protein